MDFLEMTIDQILDHPELRLHKSHLARKQLSQLRAELDAVRHSADYAHQCLKDCRAELDAAKKWREVVDQRLVLWNMVASDDPTESLRRLLRIEIDTSMDPCVSEDAIKLRDTYKAELDAAKKERADLMQELNEAGLLANGMTGPQVVRTHKALAAQVDRMREALEEIEGLDTDYTLSPDANMNRARELARKAQEGKP